MNLSKFIKRLTNDLQYRSKNNIEKINKQFITNIFQDYEPDVKSFDNLVNINTKKGYTRHIIKSDFYSYSLQLLCWNHEFTNNIEKHNCQGCWIKPIEGIILQKKYMNINGRLLESEYDALLPHYNEISFIKNNEIYQLINYRKDYKAMALILYCPPIYYTEVYNKNNPYDIYKYKYRYTSISGKKY